MQLICIQKDFACSRKIIDVACTRGVFWKLVGFAYFLLKHAPLGLTNLLQKSFNKFFSRHGLIVEKYGAALWEMRLAIQAWIPPSYPHITYLLPSVVFQLYLGACTLQFYFERAHYLFIYLIYVYI